VRRIKNQGGMKNERNQRKNQATIKGYGKGKV